MTTHQGFANYATFGVATTIENDRARAERVHGALEQLEGELWRDENVRDGTWTRDQAFRFRAADWLKEYTEREAELGTKGGDVGLVACQLVQAGLADVDWTDLARYFIDARSSWS